MHSFTLRRILALCAVSSLACWAPAADKPAPPPAEKPADSYPLKTCVVSGEPLGSMGESIIYVHREAGKPDRQVRFCCEGCIEDFKGDPARFLKKLDDAARQQAEKSARR